jgi:hypothetical protein
LRRPLFTAPDAWSGGWYETSLFYPPGSDIVAALRAVWAFTRIVAGPVASSRSEPSDQRAVEPTAAPDALYGVFALPDGAQTTCATICGSYELDEVIFGLPLGSLSDAWPQVEGFPFGVTEADVETWEPMLEVVLVKLAHHVHDRAPLLRGLTGFEASEFWEDLGRPGPIPPEHGAGIIDVDDGRLVWYPPTNRRGFSFGP